MKTVEKQITETVQGSDSPVLEEQENGIVRLTLNRPEQFNSLSEAMLETLQEKIDAIAENKDARLVILQAAGKAFCAGHDLKEMTSTRKESYYKSLFQQCSRMMLTLNKIPQPVIACVHGIATAAGCQLVATCDLAIASTLSSFAVSGINNGLFCTTPGVALSRNLSRKHSMEMLLTGDFISAERAVEVGLINKAVDESVLSISVEELAIKLSEKSFHSLKIGKQAFYQHIEMGISDAYKFASTEMANNVMDKDAAEGFDAFINKRQPVWDQSPRKALVDKDKT